jgi:hypothetical protein
MGDPYRDSLDGLRSRINELRCEIRALEQRTTDELWRRLPDELAERLQNLGGSAADADALDFDTLSRLEQALRSQREALDEAIALAPRLEQAARALPATVPEVELPMPLDNTPVDDVFGPLSEIVARLDPLGRVRRQEYGAEASFAVAGVPFLLVYLLNDGVLATSVASATPTLHLSPKGYWHTLLSHGLAELQREDPDFDGTFLVEAHDLGHARRLLTPELRASLLEIARLDVPRLTVERGRAELRWCYEPVERAIRAAVRVLAAVRGAPVEVRLLR